MAKKTNKTAHVLKLLAGATDAVNPAIADPHKAKKPANEKPEDMTQKLVRQSAPEVLSRFGCCDCSECVDWLCAQTEQKFEPCYKKDMGDTAEEREQAASKLHREIRAQLVKIVIANKKRFSHE